MQPPGLAFSVPPETWLTIAAIIIGPLAALLIQKHLENRRVKEDRKIMIFRNLMANRASRLSQPYVQALNGIETEFYGERKVIEAWRSLNDHLYTPQPEERDPNRVAWGDRLTDLLTELLFDMARSLGYHFDKVTLRRNVYYPTGWNTLELENTKLRQAAVRVFEGEKPLKIEVTNAAEPPRP
jgi:uncharacterized protein DUF6680